MTNLFLKIVLGDARFLFDAYHDGNYRTVKIRGASSENYLKSKSNGDKNKNLSLNANTEETWPYFEHLMNHFIDSNGIWRI